MDVANWKDNFGELNFHGKVVGDSCIDWSCDHQIIVGTTKKVFACDMSMLIAGSKADEIGCMIENVPVSTEKKNYMSEIPNFLVKFEQACSQTSNTKAHPDYDVYKFFLDAGLYNEKFKELKGYKSLKFSHTDCVSTTGTELLAVLSTDYSLGVYQKVSAGLHGKWTLLCDLSSSLIDYLIKNNQFFTEYKITSKTEFGIVQEKKYSSCIACMSWSDVLITAENERYCYLGACTLNGFVILWKFNLDDNAEIVPIIFDIFFSNWKEVVSITWQKRLSYSAFPQNKLGLAFSNLEGQIFCRSCQPNTEENNNLWKNCCDKLLWEEEDRLVARKMKWLEYNEGSLFITSKSHLLVVWMLNENLEILKECILQDVHSMPIVCLNVFEKNHELQCYTSSSDGVISHVTIHVTPKLEVCFSKFISTKTVKRLADNFCTRMDIAPDSKHTCYSALAMRTANEVTAVVSASDLQSKYYMGSFRIVSPVTLHGTSLSPNKAFMVMLTSRPHVRLSVQVDNEASIFMKRLVYPQEAAEKLLQVVETYSDDTLYKYLDLIEIIRQYFAMTHKFVPILESFLANKDIKLEYDVKKLQLRWFLLKIKNKVNKCSRRTALVTEMSPALVEDDEFRQVETILTTRQMTKVLTVWFHRTDHSDASVPVVPLLKMLSGKTEFLNENDIEFLNRLRLLPDLKSFPVQQTCSFTALPADMASDCRTANTLDGSSWPLCCLTFNMLQGYEKRKCELSGLFSAFPDTHNSHWMNELLETSCIFSSAPLRRYIN